MENKNTLWSKLWTVGYIMFLLVFVASYTITYLTENVQVASFSQLLYTMQVSMGGAENVVNQVLIGFLQAYSGWIFLVSLIYVAVRRMMGWYGVFAQGKPYAKRNVARLANAAVLMSACVCLAASSVLGDKLSQSWDILGIEEYMESRSHYSTLYETYYERPNKSTLHFPDQKKNLIYIFCESMESTYGNVWLDEQGTRTANLIPNLTALATQEGNCFGAGALNGPRVTNSTSWTVAGMVAQTSGTPLALSNGAFTKNFEDETSFMPKVTSLGEILQQQGYSNYLMVGSDAAYGGRSNYFSQHGDYEIFDLYTARDEGKIPAGYKEWWGFEDEKLFEYAKEKISSLAQTQEPFNFTMLTADTHFKDGYECPHCPDLYEEQMENVIACSDAQLGAFISWIQEQPFYEDTVVIISGDHLSMDGLIPQIAPPDKPRRTYFNVLNGPKPAMEQAREYTTLDLFPTTLGAMGVSIEGDRLGLGVNLYGTTPTLSESLGFDVFNEEISYNSRYYDENILDTQNEQIQK